MPTAAPELQGYCTGCGACCRVLVLEQSPEDIRNMATLTSVLGIPSDHVFAARHWQPITREEGLRRNPFYVSRLSPEAYLYSCDKVAADGRCTVYEERPLVCRGYPWYDQPPKDMPLADPECSYAVDRPSAGTAVTARTPEDPGAGRSRDAGDR